MLLYNFRGQASMEHQALLVQVALEFLAGSTRGECFIAHDSRPASLNVALALWRLASHSRPVYLGRCSTPSVAFACRRQRCLAVVVTASHNTWDQVGLKLFDKTGVPLSPTAEDELMKCCTMQRVVPLSLPFKHPHPSKVSALDEYFSLLEARSLRINAADVAVEVGMGWVQDTQMWMPGFEVKGAARTDPSSVAPERNTTRLLMRVDEDLDKLVLWAQGREVPGQLLLTSWLATRPIGIICLSFDVTLFAQRYLQKQGYEVVLCPVGDQFIAQRMVRSCLQTGGEPNGHYIAAERSFCPDALASALDLLERGNLDFSWWRSQEASYYCRAIMSPFPFSLEEAVHLLMALPALRGFQFAPPPETNAVIAEDEGQRVILRISRFEQVAVIQTEGKDAKWLFAVVTSSFPIGSIQRRESWIK